MRVQMRTKQNKNLPRWILLVAIAFSVFILFELYRIIVPFQPQDPLWHEVTIGESVIDGWNYEGQDEEGYLKFSNPAVGNQQTVLPPSAHIFSADGKFVVIEDYTPSSLTYAEPYDAIPVRWILIGVLAIAVVGALVGAQIKQKKSVLRMRSRTSPYSRAARFKSQAWNRRSTAKTKARTRGTFKSSKRWFKK